MVDKQYPYVSQSSNYVASIGTRQWIPPKRAWYEAVSLCPVISPLFGVEKTLFIMSKSHDLCRLNSQTKYSFHFSCEPSFFGVGRTLNVLLQLVNHPFSFWRRHQISCQLTCSRFTLIAGSPRFHCGEDTGFHVSSHDLNSKYVLKKARKKEEEMYLQSQLRK